MMKFAVYDTMMSDPMKWMALPSAITMNYSIYLYMNGLIPSEYGPIHIILMVHAPYLAVSLSIRQSISFHLSVCLSVCFILSIMFDNCDCFYLYLRLKTMHIRFTADIYILFCASCRKNRYRDDVLCDSVWENETNGRKTRVNDTSTASEHVQISFVDTHVVVVSTVGSIFCYCCCCRCCYCRFCRVRCSWHTFSSIRIFL